MGLMDKRTYRQTDGVQHLMRLPMEGIIKSNKHHPFCSPVLGWKSP